MRQFGLKPVRMTEPVCSMNAFGLIIDDAQIEADESFKTSKMALRDGTLNEAELEDIIQEATAAMRKQEEIIAMANKRLEEIRGMA